MSIAALPAVSVPTDSALTDEELADAALAADLDAPIGDDVPSLWDLVGGPGPAPLPSWYMPPTGGGVHLRGWKRGVVFAVIAAFLTITAYGLCNTYGQLGLH